jgi:mannose-6-phosphate isomerase class I
MSTGGTTNYAMNLTASGSFLRAHGNGDGSAGVYEVEPPAAGEGERWAGWTHTEHPATVEASSESREIECGRSVSSSSEILKQVST